MGRGLVLLDADYRFISRGTLFNLCAFPSEGEFLFDLFDWKDNFGGIVLVLAFEPLDKRACWDYLGSFNVPYG